VKPANCLFIGGDLRVADFGLLTTADRQGSVVGTPKYMPPDRNMDARADVYAAGLIIREMVTGLPTDTFSHVGEKADVAADDANLRVLNELAQRACDPDPERRFQDAPAMLAELEARTRPARRWTPIVVLVGGVLILLAAFVWFLGPWGDAPEHVHVNFITEPYDAEVYLNDTRWLEPDGTPYRTPCTIPDLPPRVYHVVFKREGITELDVGEFDFAATREIVASWDH